MKALGNKLLLSLMTATLPVVIYANSGANPAVPAPPIKRTGAQVDGGLTCTACHATFAPANSDPRGSITIQATNYKPGVKQTIRVTVSHPDAARWGFQITARPVSDETRKAGVFSVTDEVQVRCDDGAVRGAPAPCQASQLEFASHNGPSTGAGTRTSRSWDVEWTPPINEVGDIIFYASGNAADNGGTNANDRIYTTSLRIKAEGACTLSTRPTLRSISDAASFRAQLNMNQLVSIFGLNFQVAGNTRQAGLGDLDDNGAFPKQLGCVAVEIAGRRVPIYYVQNDQINAQVPSDVPIGNVDVRVILNPGTPSELRSDVATGIPTTDFAPSFFTFNGRSIAARHPDFSIAADPAVVPGGRPVRPGDVVLLFLTGLGPTQPVYQAGEIPAGQTPLRDRGLFSITIGGTTVPPADVLYVGGAPGAISGLYQVNVRVPASTPDGDAPVVARMGSGSSQANATIPVRR